MDFQIRQRRKTRAWFGSLEWIEKKTDEPPLEKSRRI